MTVQELASALNGGEYCEEITPEEESLAERNRLVVVFGYSDDLTEFRGAISMECGSWDGATFFIHSSGKVLVEDHKCECDYCGYKSLRNESMAVESLRAAETGYSWTFKTDIPHATFDIFDGAESFCRGIVFSLDDVAKKGGM